MGVGGLRKPMQYLFQLWSSYLNLHLLWPNLRSKYIKFEPIESFPTKAAIRVLIKDRLMRFDPEFIAKVREQQKSRYNLVS